jgi:TPR repeat protein
LYFNQQKLRQTGMTVERAQLNLGLMYSKGHGVPQDYKEAIKYFRLSAEQGNADAQMVLDALIKK